MAIHSILRAGNPLLTQRSEIVPYNELTSSAHQTLLALINDLFETMDKTGGVGLAAPQIGVLRRIIVYGFERNERYLDRVPIPKRALINPVITHYASASEEGYEGCLSLPGLRGKVARACSIYYEAISAQGEKMEAYASGFEARIIQHEVDHLNGILFFNQKTADLKTFGFEEELQKHAMI